MSESIAKEHPLTAFMLEQGSVRTAVPSVQVTVEPFLSHINIRGNPDDTQFNEAVTRVLSLDLPLSNRVVRGAQSVYWLGPQEFLVISRDPDSQQLVDALNHALQGQHAAVTDLSGGQVLMSVSGMASRSFLSKASTLDLHDSVFKAGHCAQSTFAKAAALYALRDEDPVFELVIRRSFADYAARWMAYAGQEFGIGFDQLVKS